MDDGASQRSLGEEIRQLRAIVERFLEQSDPAGRLTRQQRIEAILDSQAHPPPQRPKRDRHGLHVVRGFALAAAVALVRTRVRRAVVGAALASATVTAAALSPDVIAPAPAAQVPGHRPHHAAAHRGRPGAPAPSAAVVPPRRRRRAASGAAATPSASVSPSVSAGPAPTAPGPTVPPDPQPTVPVPVPPVPTPRPSCTHGQGHCHGDDAVNALGALRGLSGLACDDMPGARETMLP